jgi:hypothetical protein
MQWSGGEETRGREIEKETQKDQQHPQPQRKNSRIARLARGAETGK